MCWVAFILKPCWKTGKLFQRNIHMIFRKLQNTCYRTFSGYWQTNKLFRRLKYWSKDILKVVHIHKTVSLKMDWSNHKILSNNPGFLNFFFRHNWTLLWKSRVRNDSSRGTWYSMIVWFILQFYNLSDIFLLERNYLEFCLTTKQNEFENFVTMC